MHDTASLEGVPKVFAQRYLSKGNQSGDSFEYIELKESVCSREVHVTCSKRWWKMWWAQSTLLVLPPKSLLPHDNNAFALSDERLP